MTPPTSSDDMPDDDLRALLHDAVSDVEPHDRLAEVRRRTRARRRTGRRWTPVLVGAGAVAATVVAAGFVVSALNDGPQDDADSPVAGSSTTADQASTASAAIYYLSDTATGARLFREFQAVTPSDDPDQAVLTALERLTTDARDPDYRTLWPADSFSDVDVADDRIVVSIGNPAALDQSAEGALGILGIQQVVYTAEATLESRLPVTFEYDGAPAQQVLGVRVGPLVQRSTGYNITAPVNISDPSEHLAVEDGTLEANGSVASNIEGGVHWSLVSGSAGGDVVLEGDAMPSEITGSDARATLGAPGWKTDPIDVSGLAPGSYVFVVRVQAVGQTSDRPAEFTDTRTITVR